MSGQTQSTRQHGLARHVLNAVITATMRGPLNLNPSALSAANGWRAMMMTNLRAWWSSKSKHRRQNWMLLAMALCFVASGFVESGIWWPVLLCIVPGSVLLWLELTNE